MPRRGISAKTAIALALAGLAGAATRVVSSAEPPVRPDKPNTITFPAQDAAFVRFVVRATTGAQACIDELEVYGPDGARNLALQRNGGRASASSCLAGYAVHRIAHLNDARYGNDHSWIAAGTGVEWAQIQLAKVTKVAKVVFSRDRNREYADRVPIAFEIRVSLDGKQWTTVRKVCTSAAAVKTTRRGRRARPTVPSPPPPPRVVKGKGGAVVAPSHGDVGVPTRNKLGFANLALGPAAKPNASSVFAEGRLPIHQVRHLNDGIGGNTHSWISAVDPSWAEIDLGDLYWVYQVAFASDRKRDYNDRAATAFSILCATQYHRDTNAAVWRTAWRQVDGPPVRTRRAFTFRPVRARWVRVSIETASAGLVRLDEIEVFGHTKPIPLSRIGPIPTPVTGTSTSGVAELLRDAFLAEEHAWVKTYGRADLSPRLVPYNGRVKEYPRHAGDDRLPLPPLSSTPRLDGRLDEPCWRDASRGVVRVAYPYEFDRGPLVNYGVRAGRIKDDLYLAIRTDRLLSAHLAVVSSTDWQGAGVVTFAGQDVVFNTYTTDERRRPVLQESTPVDAAHNDTLTCWEIRLPLSLFPGCRDSGLRVGLGMGGRHTNPLGRPVHFAFSSLAVAELPAPAGHTFRVRLAVPPHASPVRLTGNVPGLGNNMTIGPGQSRTIAVPAERDPIGRAYDLRIGEHGAGTYVLHLFRYDPLVRTLERMGEMVGRLSAKGVDVRAERAELARLRTRHAAMAQGARPDRSARRKAFFDARLAKRRLLLRDPDLARLGRILFVKRRPFQPSHIYTDYTDAPFRPGGGVCVLDVPQRNGRIAPAEATVTTLFRAKGGIARNPVATFDRQRIYFGYRATARGYYHILAMNADGTGLRQVTHGPFHDFYPCPLPDGGVAFISTRCTSRVFCFRGGSSVLFRMDPDGRHIRALSFASLSEWAPSVMRDGRIIWTRWEYVDKGADFTQTLWSIRPDGTQPELVFGNTIIQPNGYANGREVPGTSEICCTLVSHFGDLNGPIALVDVAKGRFNPKAITSITPEVPWPGMWPVSECFRDPLPLSHDYVLCSHAPRNRFGLYVIDRFGNRELVYMDRTISSMYPTLFRVTPPPPVLAGTVDLKSDTGRLVLADVYRGISPPVRRGTVKYIRVVEEVRHQIARLPNGEYRIDHPNFMAWYASPVDKVSGPFGWPTYVAKAALGIVPVQPDGSANFVVPAGKNLYVQALDADLNELQRMRSNVQLQPGETRSCIGCHESRKTAPPRRRPIALARAPRALEPPSWGAVPFSYERVVQPVLDAKCVRCHNPRRERMLDLTATHDANHTPASYRTLIRRGLVHYVDCGWNSAGCEKREPLTFGTLESKLWQVLGRGHHGVTLTRDQMRRIKTWIDLNCPLWPDYVDRKKRARDPDS